jgi:hypothetical protein
LNKTPFRDAVRIEFSGRVLHAANAGTIRPGKGL